MADGRSEPVLSVILITRNGLPLLVDQVRAVLAQSWDGSWELVAVDNDSDDGTGAFLADLAAREPRLRVVTARARRSVAHARNEGAAQARGRYVAFVDGDDLVGEGWLSHMAECVQRHQYVAAQIDLSRLNRPELAAARASLASTAIGRIGEVPMPAGATIAVRRDWFLAIGGNDETFTQAAEDLDWAVRFHRRFAVEPVRCALAVYHVRLRDEPHAALVQGIRYGRAYVQLFARWPNVLDRPPATRQLAGAARRWARLVGSSRGALRSRSRRTAFAFELGRSVGRFVGTVEHRHLLL